LASITVDTEPRGSRLYGYVDAAVNDGSPQYTFVDIPAVAAGRLVRAHHHKRWAELSGLANEFHPAGMMS
jgi:hypothetical protein